MANGTGNGGKESKSSTVATTGVIGSGVGAALGNFINVYAHIDPILHSDTITLCIAAIGGISAIAAHIATRVDRDHDGIPDFLRKQVVENEAKLDTIIERTGG